MATDKPIDERTDEELIRDSAVFACFRGPDDDAGRFMVQLGLRLRERNAQVATLESEKWQLRAQLALRRVKERPPVETFTKPWCKGYLELGGGCGTCERCEWYREQIRRAEEPRVPVSEIERWLTRFETEDDYDIGDILEELYRVTDRIKREHGSG